MSRPQRQGRTSVSYKEDHLDVDLGIQQGALQLMEQTRSKRTLALKRSSRTQDRAEAKQLERAITESLNRSCVKTYSRVGLERPVRILNQNSYKQTETVQMDGGVAIEETDAFQVLVDAASADNSTVVDVEPAKVEQQAIATFHACSAVHVTEKPCAAEASADLQQFNEVGPAAARSDGPDDKSSKEDAACSESESESEELANAKKTNKRSISRNKSDEDEWSAGDDDESDEDDEDQFVEDSDDEDGVKVGPKKNRRAVKPAAPIQRPHRTLKRGVSATGSSLKHSPKRILSRSPKEPAKRQKPASFGEVNVTLAIGAQVSGQDNLASKVTSASQKSVKAANVSVSPASEGVQHPRRVPLKSLHAMSATKPSISPPTPGSGPPLQFPSIQHRRVLGLSKRFQPPPLHPYLHGT